MVFTFMFRNFTMRMLTMTAMSEPGIFSEIRGQMMSMARQTNPTRTACRLTVPIFLTMAAIFSMVSMVTVPAG